MHALAGRLIGVAALAALAILVVGALALGQEGDVVIIEDKLAPKRLEVAAGTVVTWRNQDDERHRIRSREGPVEFDSGNLEPGGRVTFIITGGLRVPTDFVKALALGADGIGVSNSAMQAVGCVAARMCNSNDCPAGVATQKPEFEPDSTSKPPATASRPSSARPPSSCRSWPEPVATTASAALPRPTWLPGTTKWPSSPASSTPGTACLRGAPS